MKYLKKYNESSDNIEQVINDIKQTIEDIFLDLKDDGYGLHIRNKEVINDHNTWGGDVYKIPFVVSLEKIQTDGRYSDTPFIFSEVIDEFDRMFDYVSTLGDAVTDSVSALLNNPNEHKDFNQYRYNNWSCYKDKLRKEYGLATLVRYVTIRFTLTIS